MNWILILITFLGVNLDFFFILMVLLHQFKLRSVIIGYVTGLLILLLASFFAGQLLDRFLPEWLLGILGVLPIYMAFQDDDGQSVGHHSPIMTTLITYLSVCTGCNLALFLPVMTNITLAQLPILLVALIALSILVVVLIKLIGTIPVVQRLIERGGEITTKIIYVGVGLYVFWDSGLISHILALI